MGTTVIFVAKERCTGCGACVEACPRGALYLDDGTAHVLTERCTGCEACIDACAENAIYAVSEPGVPAPAEPRVPEVARRTDALPARPAWVIGLGAVVSAAGRLLPAIADVAATLLTQRSGDERVSDADRPSGASSSQAGRGPHRHRHGRG